MPAYFPPGDGWNRLIAPGAAVGVAIVNPDSGPGRERNPLYSSAVQAARAAGTEVFGYVATGFGHRPSEDVLAEVARYAGWYQVDGIFLDEAGTDCALAGGYYRQIYEAVKRLPGRDLVALNPGTATRECYMSVGDLVVTFEGSYAAYVGGYTAPDWVRKYPAGRFWHLVYAAAPDSMTELDHALALSRERRAGVVFVTTGTDPNPWGALPGEAFWLREQGLTGK